MPAPKKVVLCWKAKHSHKQGTCPKSHRKPAAEQSSDLRSVKCRLMTQSGCHPDSVPSQYTLETLQRYFFKVVPTSKFPSQCFTSDHFRKKLQLMQHNVLQLFFFCLLQFTFINFNGMSNHGINTFWPEQQVSV